VGTEANKRIERLIKQAKFKENASIADIDFNSSRNLDKNMFNRLSTLDFIRRKENLIITGASHSRQFSIVIN